MERTPWLLFFFALGLLALLLIWGVVSKLRRRGKATVDHDTFKKSRVETRMEEFNREHPEVLHSKICKGCGYTTSAGGADCPFCESLRTHNKWR